MAKNRRNRQSRIARSFTPPRIRPSCTECSALRERYENVKSLSVAELLEARKVLDAVPAYGTMVRIRLVDGRDGWACPRHLNVTVGDDGEPLPLGEAAPNRKHRRAGR